MATDLLTGPTIMGTATRTRVYKNFIDGESVEASTGQTFENRDPADTRRCGWHLPEVRQGRRGCGDWRRETGLRKVALDSRAPPG